MIGKHACQRSAKVINPKTFSMLTRLGLFFRTLPSKSLQSRRKKASGGKLAKDRITVLLACSAEGEKLKPLVIGKSFNPRAMRGIPKSELPVKYHANKKAWMTSDLFKQWVESLNVKMQNAHVGTSCY